MRKLQWLDTKKRSLKQIQKYLDEKYGMEICMDENVSWLDKAMEMSRQIFIDIEEEFEDVVKERVLKDVLDTVLCPENYKEDIKVGMYMYLSYMMQFSDKAIISTEDFGKFEKTIDRKKWGEEAKNNFPMYIDDEVEGWTGVLWCKEYQKTFFTSNNIDIFDYEKEEKDITRYGFKKIKDISDKLKGTNIENLILLDMTMGISLTKVIYTYLNKVIGSRDLEIFNDIIKNLGSIECLCLRNQIAHLIFYKIEMANYSIDYINECSIALEKICSDVNEYYNDILYLIWWDIVHESGFSSKQYIEDERETIESFWKEYYNDDDLYEEWLNDYGIYRFKYNDHQDTTTFDMIRNMDNYAKCSNDLGLMEKNNNIGNLLVLMRDGDERQALGSGKEPRGDNIIKCDNGYLIGKAIKKGALPKDSIKTTSKLNKVKLYALIHRIVISSCLQKYKKDKL